MQTANPTTAREETTENACLPGGARREWVWPLLILVAALLAFEPALRNEFCHDDLTQVKELALPRTAAGWIGSVAQSWWPLSHHKTIWRPLTRLTILIQKALSDDRAWPFYAVNMALHAGVALLVFWLARRMGWGATGAGAAALLFAIHPIHGEAVHQVVGRAELLAAGWMLLGLGLFFAHGLRGRAWAWQQPLCFALALGSKEHAVLYPLFLLLAGCSGRVPAVGRATRRRVWGLFAALVLVAALFLAGKTAVTGGLVEPAASTPFHENPLASMGAAERLPGVLGIFGWALSRVLWPLGLSPDYSYVSFPFDRGWEWPWSWVGAALLGLILTYCVYNGLRGGRGWLLGVAGLISYALVSNGPFAIGVVTAERLWYGPSVAVFLGVGWVVGRLCEGATDERRRIMRLLATLIGVLLIAAAWADAPAWLSTRDYAERTLRRFPHNWRAHVNLAREDCLAGEFEAGFAHARRATEILPGNAYGWDWLGMNAMFLAGREGEAEGAFARALALDPTLAKVHEHWAALLERQGRLREAIGQIENYLATPEVEDRAFVEQRLEALRGKLPDSTARNPRP